MKNKAVWIGGLVGLIWGVLSYPILWTNTIIGYVIAFPIMIVAYIHEASTGGSGPSMIMFLSILLSILIGMLMGYIINKLIVRK
ncbi:MAG: hypothetical protein ABIB47_03340 [Candidatus Woesearchaeota archaeon]